MNIIEINYLILIIKRGKNVKKNSFDSKIFIPDISIFIRDIGNSRFMYYIYN